jgi:hypothetical protein
MTQRQTFVTEGPFSMGVMREQYDLKLPEDLRPAAPEEGDEGEESGGEGDDVAEN